MRRMGILVFCLLLICLVFAGPVNAQCGSGGCGSSSGHMMMSSAGYSGGGMMMRVMAPAPRVMTAPQTILVHEMLPPMPVTTTRRTVTVAAPIAPVKTTTTTVTTTFEPITYGVAGRRAPVPRGEQLPPATTANPKGYTRKVI